MTQTESAAGRLRSLMRRFGAMVYDALLLAALMIVPTVLVVAVRQDAILPGSALHRVYQLVLLGIVVGFYVLSWTRRQQTLGMRAWQLQVLRRDGRAMAPADALLRLAASLLSLLPLGAGYLWILVDRQGLAWHDRLTDTRISFAPNR